jgi:hypothetical protein
MRSCLDLLVLQRGNSGVLELLVSLCKCLYETQRIRSLAHIRSRTRSALFFTSLFVGFLSHQQVALGVDINLLKTDH